MVKKKLSYTLEEQLVSALAREFTPEDEIGVTAIFTFSFVAATLAQELYAPKLAVCMMAKGRWGLLNKVRYPFEVGKPPGQFIEALMTMDDIFDFLVRGKWNIFMQPAQIDKYGNMNISTIGDWHKPKAALVGARGVPDNTTNGGRVYYNVANHTNRVFVEKVDFVCGAGYGPERKQGVIKWGAPKKVFTNLGVFDFEKKTGRMRVASVHTGVTQQQVVENTGFELIWPKRVPETPPPSEEELHLLREIMDPAGVRRLDFVKGDDFNRVMKEIQTGTTYEMVYGK